MLSASKFSLCFNLDPDCCNDSNRVPCRGKNQVSLLNIMMQLRKTCNHLELIADMAEEELERWGQPPAS